MMIIFSFEKLKHKKKKKKIPDFFLAQHLSDFGCHFQNQKWNHPEEEFGLLIEARALEVEAFSFRLIESGLEMLNFFKQVQLLSNLKLCIGFHK
jgi:hypothetical protein